MGIRVNDDVHTGLEGNGHVKGRELTHDVGMHSAVVAGGVGRRARLG